MFVAGVPIRDDLVRTLAIQVDDEGLAEKLQRAVVRETQVVALEVDERHAILRALKDCPEGLGELRATLLAEHIGRQAIGLWRESTRDPL